MTNQQGAPEALRLADSLELCWGDGRLDEAAAELRRLHAENERLAAMVEAPQPATSAASKAVLAAIRAANMQLVRTGDDEFMLVTYKNAKAQCDGGKCGIGGYCDDCPTPQADSSQDEPLQAFDSPRAKALMRAWEEGWAACRDAEYVGEEAQNDAFNSSHTLTLCIAEDQQLPAPQADSQPAPVRDERDDFEKVFPLPSGCIRVGTGYASTGYSNWTAHTHCERWQGWQARAARAPADSVTAPAGAGVAHALSDAQIEAMPVWRNFVGLWPESRREIVDAVVDLLTPPPSQAADSVLAELAEADRRAGAAERALAVCKEDVARFEQVRDKMKYQWGSDRRVSFDEVWAEALALKAAATAQPAPAPSVLEDAARLDWLELAGPTSICRVIARPHDDEVEVATDDVTGYGKTLREAIDAASKQGGKP